MLVYKEFAKTVKGYAEHAFLHIPRQATAAYQHSPVDLTYRQAFDEAQVLREKYHAAGYGLGQRVVLMLDNRAEYFVHFLALNSLGVSIVPVNSAFSPAEMEYVITHSDASLVLVLPEHLDKTQAALKTSGNQVPVRTTAQSSRLPVCTQAVADGAPDLGTEVALLYTSGTTGRPKGCMLSTEYFLCLGQSYIDYGGYCALENGKERLITPLPLVHMNALFSMMAMIMTGGCVIQLDRFHASSWWGTVRASRATCLHYLGVMPAILLNQTERPEDDFSGQIKFGFGAGCDPKHQERFERRFGFPLVEGWASTETGTHVCILANKEPRHLGQRCIGRPCTEIDYRLLDEGGREAAPGAPGELLLRCKGAHPRKGFFSGYYKDPAESAAVWEGGYFHTGDVVRVDNQGLFFFVDRRKNIIRRSGENIAAVEVEAVLFEAAEVANCAATPIYDELRGEEVGACVVLNEDVQPNEETAKAIFAFCQAKLIYYKLPGYFFFLDCLPMTASQKIQRGELKQIAAAMIERGECIDLCAMKRKGNR